MPAATGVVSATFEAVSPVFGELLFSDDFTNPDLWTLGRSATGSAALGKQELTLAISGERGYISSLRRQDDLDDFYVEVTASPSICRGEDEYGLLLRVSPSDDFYRFALNCQGEARLDRYLDGKASSPQAPTMSGAIPPGAPSSSRLGARMSGKELQFFANGEYLFTVRDPSLVSGSLGIFARAAGADAVTVNFSDLAVYAPDE
jgi:hypothetical protein